MPHTICVRGHASTFRPNLIGTRSIVAQREPRCSFLVKFGGGGGDFFSGALRLSVTTPRQPFGLVLRSTRAPPNNMFSQRFITCTWYLLCKNTKIWRSTNYSSITLQYDLSHRVPTFDLWMLAPQERKVVFHEHSLQKLARVTMAENAHRGEEKEVALHDETPDRMASSLNRRQRDAYNACKEIVKGNQVLLLMCGGPGTGACAGFLFVALP